MLADSEPHNECDYSWNWVMVGKAKHNKGGVKWVSTPMSRGKTTPVYLSDVECSHPPKEGPLPPVGGGFIPSIRNDEDENNEETRIDSQSTRMCSSKKQGGSWINPLHFTWATGLIIPGISPPSNSKL